MPRKTKMRLYLTHEKTFPALRVNPGSRDLLTGEWSDGGVDPTFTSVKGNEQPLPGYERQMLPDAFRSKDYRKFFSNTFMYSIEEDQQRTPDEITIDGYQFIIDQRKSYQMGVRDHYEYRIIRKEQSAGG